MASPGIRLDKFTDPTKAERFISFAKFFKSYMSVSTLVVAALPIPVGYFKLIPTFEAQRSYLSVYTSLFCFLSLGFIFFQRHRLGYYMFRGPRKQERWASKGLTPASLMVSFIRGIINWLPLACILLSVFAVFRYHKLFNDAVLIAQAQATAEAQKGDLANAFLADIAEGDYPTKIKLANTLLLNNNFVVNAQQVKSQPDAHVALDEAADQARAYASWTWGTAPLVARRYVDQQQRPHFEGGDVVNALKFVGTGTPVPNPDEVLKRKIVPLGNELLLWYLVIFVSAEAAFILMALKEYLQDMLDIPEDELVGLKDSAKGSKSGRLDECGVPH